jgi:addiction module HigA family antidote
MSAAELARKLDAPTNRITGVLHGQRATTGDTALRLAHFFGTSAEFWRNLQTLYEPRGAEVTGEIDPGASDVAASGAPLRVRSGGPAEVLQFGCECLSPLRNRTPASCGRCSTRSPLDTISLHGFFPSAWTPAGNARS